MSFQLFAVLSLLAASAPVADDDAALPTDKRDLAITCAGYAAAEQQYHVALNAGKIDAVRAKGTALDWIAEARKIGGDNWESDVGTASLIAMADKSDLFAAKLNRCATLAGE